MQLRGCPRGLRLRFIMRDGRASFRVAFWGTMLVALCAVGPRGSYAMEWSGNEGSTVTGPSLEEYLKQIGPDGKVIAHGQLKIDGRGVNCGKRPTVLNPNFDSWGGAFPGFLILNTKKISGLSTQVKLYVYSHECGHQFQGADESKADLFAIRRGVRWGWLDAQGMEEICVFISQLKGDSVHAPGPKRCDIMRAYYRKLIDGEGQRAKAPASVTGAQTLGPAH
jgi:hypothetical protein